MRVVLFTSFQPGTGGLVGGVDPAVLVSMPRGSWFVSCRALNHAETESTERLIRGAHFLHLAPTTFLSPLGESFTSIRAIGPPLLEAHRGPRAAEPEAARFNRRL